MSAADKFLEMARRAFVTHAREGGTGEGGTASDAAPPADGAGGPFRGVPSRPVVIARPVAAPEPRVLASFAPAGAVLGDRVLSRGARRLWDHLHALAVDAARTRGYLDAVHQVVYHCPLVTLAGLLDVTSRHLARLAHELEAVGLLDSGGHAQRVGLRSMYDGTLWAVLMVPEGEPPRLRAEDWRHCWRPDFAADVEGKTGAAAEMSELLKAEADEAEKYGAARLRAANSGLADGQQLPPLSSSDILPRPCLRAVVEALPGLLVLHSSKRARAVGVLASQIAAALVEPDRRRYWCRIIWDALRAENELRPGLQVLAAQFARLDVDIREGAPWRNPGAVLAARLKSA